MKKNGAQKRLTVKEYARRHRLSIFQVVKKINSGELPSETITENGQEIRYILPGSSSAGKEASEGNPAERSEKGPESNASCSEELRRLREEVQELRLLVERCCKNRG